MDWATILQDAGVLAAASTAIFFVIDFIKRLYYKLPWGWVQKTPGEVWFALSIAFGVGAALLIFWNQFFGADASLTTGLSSAVYGLISGAGSKLVNSVASTAGVKLKASRVESQTKIATLTTAPVIENTTPIVSEEPTVLEKRIEEAKKRINQEIIMIPKDTDVPLVELVKRMKTDADFAIIDGKIYEIKKEGE
jgi:hypothetical protein